MNFAVPGFLAAALAMAGVAAASDLPAPAERVIDYHKDIAPIFEALCIECHGADKQKSDYRLDTRDDAIGSGSEGGAIIPGNSEDSLLVQLLAGIHPNFDIMPPKEDPLTPEQIGVVRAWIDQGAIWEGSAAANAPAAMELSDEKAVFAGLGETWIVEGTAQRGPLATWALVEEKGPGGEACVALTQANHRSAGTYNLLWDTKSAFQNGQITVALKSTAGEEDQGGGILWRAQDKNNYYVARYNPLEKNLALYQVKDGQREKIASADYEKAADTWTTLTVGQQGDQILVTLDGQTLIRAEAGTFPDAGGIGLWTKADAATVFTRPLVEMN